MGSRRQVRRWRRCDPRCHRIGTWVRGVHHNEPQAWSAEYGMHVEGGYDGPENHRGAANRLDSATSSDAATRQERSLKLAKRDLLKLPDDLEGNLRALLRTP